MLSTFLITTARASIFAFVVFLVRLAVKNRGSGRLLYWLWNGVMLLFVFPFQVPALVTYRLLDLLKASIDVQQVNAVEQAAEVIRTAPELALYDTASNMQDMLDTDSGFVLKAVLLGGFLLLAVYFLGSWILWALRFRQHSSRPVTDNDDAPSLPKLLLPVTLQKTTAVHTPCTRGILRPVIYLPMDWDFSQEELSMAVLYHELAHIRHWDNLRKLFLAALLCANWYNPIMWGVYYWANLDMELYSDHYALKHSQADIRELYAGTLLSISRKESAAPLTSSFAKTRMKERIVCIMTSNRRKKLGFTALTVVPAMLILFLCSFCTVIPQDLMAVYVGRMEIADGKEVVIEYIGDVPSAQTIAGDTIALYQGSSASVSNGNYLLFNAADYTDSETVSLNFSVLAMEGYSKGWCVEYGYSDGETFTPLNTNAYVKNGTTITFPAAQEGGEYLYIRNYAADNLYIRSVN